MLDERQAAALGNELTSTALLSSQKEDLEMWISLAKSGDLPLDRPLKEWEPEKLNDHHMMILFMRAAGLPNRRIAEITGRTEGNISIIVNHPYAQFLLTKMVAHAAEQAIDIETKIRAAAPEALNTALDIMRDKTEKGAVRARTAFELLDRAGFGSVQKKEVKKEVTIHTDAATQLAAALRESSEITDIAYVQVREVPSTEQAGSVEVSETAPAREGAVDSRVPPAGVPQDQPAEESIPRSSVPFRTKVA